MHHIFFCCCVSLSIWAFAFSIANSGPNQEMVLLWRRIAAFGWGSFFSFLIHFTLIVTKNTDILKKKWVAALIYLPAAVSVFVFDLYSPIAEVQYQLIFTPGGWINTSSGSLWDNFYNLYYISFSLIVAGLLLCWGRKTSEPNEKIQASLMLGFFSGGVVLGSLTEFILNSQFHLNIPQMAPVVILIPITVMLICIKRYGLLAPVNLKKDVAEEGEIISDLIRSKLYHYITLAFIISSFISFAVRYFIRENPLEAVLLTCGYMILTGFLIETVSLLKINKNTKDFLVSGIIAVAIPFIFFNYAIFYSIYAVAIPIIFLMVSVLFTQSRLIHMIGFVSLMTLGWLWLKTPTITVTVSNTDQLIRIFLITIFLALAIYVNRIYISRIKENEEQIGLQKLLTRITAIFVTVNETNIRDQMEEILGLSGNHFHADRAFIFFFSNKPNSENTIYEWRDSGIKSMNHHYSQTSIDEFPQWMHDNFMDHAGFMSIPDAAAFIQDSPEKAWLDQRGIKSMVVNPLVNNDRIIGFMGFERLKTPIVWRKAQIEIMKVMGKSITDTWLKVEVEKEIHYLAYYDILTGLPNRRMLNKRLEEEIERSNGKDHFIGVMFLDVDHFKSINDTMGHDAGDELLIMLAKRLSSMVMKKDMVARFGGDEFLVMISQIADLEHVQEKVEEIMSVFNQPVHIKNNEFFITGSAGIAVFPSDGVGREDLIKNADLAMYISKEQGRNRTTLCSTEIKEENQINIDLTNYLYRAQEMNELELYYQPQVDIRTEEIVGVEALIRWNHPLKGMLMPGTFISIAENTGLIIPIGEWVIRTACVQNKAWQEQGFPAIRMGVNLSVKQFRNPNLVKTVAKILQETGLDPSFLELEITESLAVSEHGLFMNNLDDLKKLGVTISIDDFGTGHSSLNRLMDLQIDRIKIDMKFIQGI